MNKKAEPMPDLIITLFQPELVWEAQQANIDNFEKKIQNLSGRYDLIILPEMFSTGFSMNAATLAETMEGPTVIWMTETARRMKAHITGSAIITENGRFYNRLIWVQPDGKRFTYDKRHLFRFANEHHTYQAGTKQITITLNGWRIRPFICYDLRFPVWTRNTGNDFDLAIYIANWPQPRADHWKALLKARAIENQAFVIGVNRVGNDGNGLEYSGDSAVIDPMGRILFQAAHQESVHNIELSYEKMNAYRQSFPALKDADRFQIKI